MRCHPVGVKIEVIMPFATHNGCRFHLQSLGSGPAVVMLHGWLIDSMVSWLFTAAPLLARSHRVLLYDMRGHGRSQRVRTGYDIATQIGDLRALLADFSGPVSLVGHSYGALVALKFALEEPERVGRLVLVEAPLPPFPKTLVEDLLGETPERLTQALPPTLQKILGQGDRRARRLLQSLQFLIMESTMIRDMQAEQRIEDQALLQIQCPVLCVYGDRSSCLEGGRRLFRTIPQAQLEVLPGGHYLHLEARAALSSLLEEFLRG